MSSLSVRFDKGPHVVAANFVAGWLKTARAAPQGRCQAPERRLIGRSGGSNAGAFRARIVRRSRRGRTRDPPSDPPPDVQEFIIRTANHFIQDIQADGGRRDTARCGAPGLRAGKSFIGSASRPRNRREGDGPALQLSALNIPKMHRRSPERLSQVRSLSRLASDPLKATPGRRPRTGSPG